MYQCIPEDQLIYRTPTKQRTKPCVCVVSWDMESIRRLTLLSRRTTYDGFVSLGNGNRPSKHSVVDEVRVILFLLRKSQNPVHRSVVTFVGFLLLELHINVVDRESVMDGSS